MKIIPIYTNDITQLNQFIINRKNSDNYNLGKVYIKKEQTLFCNVFSEIVDIGISHNINSIILHSGGTQNGFGLARSIYAILENNYPDIIKKLNDLHLGKDKYKPICYQQLHSDKKSPTLTATDTEWLFAYYFNQANGLNEELNYQYVLKEKEENKGYEIWKNNQDPYTASQIKKCAEVCALKFNHKNMFLVPYNKKRNKLTKEYMFNMVEEHGKVGNFSPLVDLQFIDINGNPLNIDCSLKMGESYQLCSSSLSYIKTIFDAVLAKFTNQIEDVDKPIFEIVLNKDRIYKDRTKENDEISKKIHKEDSVNFKYLKNKYPFIFKEVIRHMLNGESRYLKNHGQCTHLIHYFKDNPENSYITEINDEIVEELYNKFSLEKSWKSSGGYSRTAFRAHIKNKKST